MSDLGVILVILISIVVQVLAFRLITGRLHSYGRRLQWLRPTRFYLREQFGPPSADSPYCTAGEAQHPFRSRFSLICFLLVGRLPRWGYIGWVEKTP